MPEAIVPEFTKTLEEHLDVIAEAGNSYKAFMHAWFGEWSELLKKARTFFAVVAKESPSLDKRPKETMAEPCPVCKGVVHSFNGRFGKYAVCSACNHKINLEFKISKQHCVKCSELMHELQGKFGRYYKCPKCNASYNENKLKEVEESVKAGIVCPLCKAPMISREYKDKRDGKTKSFYGCSRYPNCKGTRTIAPSESSKLNVPEEFNPI
jgi:ssDNA-binding Zn-finger/Zn-ribbon topoisomerase 1